jgi:hypothetical protein
MGTASLAEIELKMQKESKNSTLCYKRGLNCFYHPLLVVKTISSWVLDSLRQPLLQPSMLL